MANCASHSVDEGNSVHYGLTVSVTLIAHYLKSFKRELTTHPQLSHQVSPTHLPFAKNVPVRGCVYIRVSGSILHLHISCL